MDRAGGRGGSLFGDPLRAGRVAREVGYWARAFINEVLSAENQTRIAAGIGEAPINLATALPDFMKGDPGFPVTAEDIAHYGIFVPVEVEARNRDHWQAAYTTAIQR